MREAPLFSVYMRMTLTLILRREIQWLIRVAKNYSLSILMW